MAISGNGSYIPTIDSFLAHWELANAAAPPTQPVVTRRGVTRANLVTLRTALVVEQATVISLTNTLEQARVPRDQYKKRLITVIGSFNAAVHAYFADTGYEAALPPVPYITQAGEHVERAARDVVDLWSQIDAQAMPPVFTPPLILQVRPENDPTGAPVPFDMAEMEALLSVYDAARTAVQSAEVRLVESRVPRTNVQDQVYQVLKDYRVMIEGRFLEGTAVRDSLPRLTPLPGATPAPVNASGVWVPVDTMGRITWTASDNANLQRYDVRYSPGTEYSTEDEVTLSSVPAAGPLTYDTLEGLTQPGTTALFRVYVVLTTGNEKGSATVIISRPAD